MTVNVCSVSHRVGRHIPEHTDIPKRWWSALLIADRGHIHLFILYDRAFYPIMKSKWQIPETGLLY